MSQLWGALQAKNFTAKGATVAKEPQAYPARTPLKGRSYDMEARGSWSTFSLLIALAVVVMVFNKLTVCSWMRRHNPGATISIIGGLLGAAACEASPSLLVKQLWWTPTALDIIGAPYLLILMWAGIRGIMRAEERL